jgi:hypothetical protein
MVRGSGSTQKCQRSTILLHRLYCCSQYRAADALSLLMLRSICGELRSLLTLDPAVSDQVSRPFNSIKC